MSSETPDASKPLTFPPFEITEPKEGVARFYANGVTLTWSGSDLTAHLYQIVQPNREVPSQKELPNQLLHMASVTLTWSNAKIFLAQLGEVVERYEKVYGPIRTEFEAI
jgi:hypothetical protein